MEGEMKKILTDGEISGLRIIQKRIAGYIKIYKSYGYLSGLPKGEDPYSKGYRDGFHKGMDWGIFCERYDISRFISRIKTISTNEKKKIKETDKP